MTTPPSPPPGDPPPLDRRYSAFREAIDGAYRAGFEHGWDSRGEAITNELRAQLQSEVEAFDPDCELCRARRELRELGRAVEALRSEVASVRNAARGWMQREGWPYPYRETR